MNQWERRILGVLALGGGFLGIVLGLALLFSQSNVLAGALVVPFLALYAWGIWCGLRILEEPKRAIKMNAWFWAVQIPYVMSSIAGYFFASGSLLYVTYEPSQAHVSMLWRFGSQFQYSLFEAGKPFVFGVNLLALFVFLWLIYRSRRVAP